MNENTDKAIFTLMQKVVDKLEAISKDINNKDHVEISDIIIKKDDETKELISKTIKNQAILNQTSLNIENRIINAIEKNKATPSVNNYNEYSLLGSRSHFKPFTLIIMLFVLVITWSSIKYIPPYFIENSLLNKEKKEYELFYNYVYLNQFKSGKINIASEILKKVRQKDTLFMKEYYTLLSTNKREIRKQKLKEELNSLNYNDR